MEDPQYKDYQNRLNNLLSNPEILKKMNDFNLKKRYSEPNSGIVNMSKKMFLDQEKKQIKMKVNYSLQFNGIQSNDDKVQKIISDVEGGDASLAHSALNEELNKQQDNFKSRLEEKKRKQSSANVNFEDINKHLRYSMFLHKISGINLSDLTKSMDTNSKVNTDTQLERICEKDENLLKSSRLKNSPSKKLNIISSKKSVSESDRTVNSDDSDDSDCEDNSSGEKVLEIQDNIERPGKIIVENSLEKFQQIKMKEFEEMFSPIPNIENSCSQYEINEGLISPEEKSYNKDISNTMFKINENVKANIIIVE